MADPRSDDALLASDDPEDFAVFYRRHARAVLACFARRVRNSELAADLTAETFASAIVARPRFRPGPAPAAAWLFAIAARRLADVQRHGVVEDRARRRLAMATPPLSYEDDELIRALAEAAAVQLLEALPADQADAVRAHVLVEEPYEDIARRTGTSEAVLRQRVS